MSPLEPTSNDPGDAGADVGYVHSHETASAVDGPGLRYVVWLMGCELRCQYCHNPDTWASPPNGEPLHADEVLQDVARYAKFLVAAGGGFTVSGGEPLLQADFAMQLIRGAKRLGLHTALDTNGHLGSSLSDADLAGIDLVLLDLKGHDPQHHRRVTGVGNEAILRFARRLSELGRPTWVRYVLVPGLTDEPDEIRAVARFTAGLMNVKRVEVLPFHQMGQHKWTQLGREYTLEQTPAATRDEVDAARAIFAQTGCPVA